ncbi:aldehyde dehydrogenase family protein, partial [Glycomyces buryatensis]
MTIIEHWIGGAFTRGASARTSAVFNPAHGTEQKQVLLAETTDVDSAVAAASKAFEAWGDSSLSQRTKVMFRMRELLVEHEDEMAKLISSEHGKVIEDARGEIIRGREVVEYACGIAEVLKGSFTDQASRGVDVFNFRQPLGVCAGITPFNFPIMVPMWMHPVAIATGNTFILKPSERDPSVSNRIAELYAEAGLPDGVFNVVHG